MSSSDPTIIPVNVNGYDTYYTKSEDNIGKFLLIHIPDYADKAISDICCTFIDGYYIQRIDYAKLDGKVTFIKAYY